MLRHVRRIAVAAGGAALLAGGALAAGSAPVAAYGPATWQVTFNGTATVPGVGGFGFWGWCDFVGANSGTGDCEFAQYNHNLIPAPSGTCEESVDVSNWFVHQSVMGPFPSFWLGSATFTIHPAQLTALCLALFPGGALPADTGIPHIPGQFHVGSLFPGVPGEFNITVTEI